MPFKETIGVVRIHTEADYALVCSTVSKAIAKKLAAHFNVSAD